MKTFEKFLKESYVGKDGKIYASKNEAKKTIAKINRLSDSQRVKQGLQGADPSTQLKGQSSNIKTRTVSKPPVTRFDPTEPFQDYDNVTTDRVSNKPVTRTSSILLDKDGKPLAYTKGEAPVKSTPGSTQITGIQDKDLESVAKGQETQAKRNIQTSKVETPKTNTVKTNQKTAVDDLTKTTNRVNKVKTLTPRQVQNVKVKNKALDIIKDLGKEKKIEDEIKSRNISKQISKSRDLKRLGFGDTNVVRKIDKKIVSLKPKVNITNPKIVSGTTDAAQKYSKLIKKAKFGRGLRTFGRGAGALTSYLDFKATADKERRLGRGKTSQTIGGLSRSLGGYIGGALGAGLAAPIPVPGARIAGAIGGYTAGAAAGEKLYNVGRKFLTRGTKIGGKTYADFKNMLTRKK